MFNQFETARAKVSLHIISRFKSYGVTGQQ